MLFPGFFREFFTKKDFLQTRFPDMQNENGVFPYKN